MILLVCSREKWCSTFHYGFVPESKGKRQNPAKYQETGSKTSNHSEYNSYERQVIIFHGIKLTCLQMLQGNEVFCAFGLYRMNMWFKIYLILLCHRYFSVASETLVFSVKNLINPFSHSYFFLLHYVQFFMFYGKNFLSSRGKGWNCSIRNIQTTGCGWGGGGTNLLYLQSGSPLNRNTLFLGRRWGGGLRVYTFYWTDWLS